MYQVFPAEYPVEPFSFAEFATLSQTDKGRACTVVSERIYLQLVAFMSDPDRPPLASVDLWLEHLVFTGVLFALVVLYAEAETTDDDLTALYRVLHRLACGYQLMFI